MSIFFYSFQFWKELGFALFYLRNKITQLFLTINEFVKEKWYDRKQNFEESQSDSITSENLEIDDMWQYFPEGNLHSLSKSCVLTGVEFHTVADEIQ